MAKLIACAGQGVELSGVPTEIKILPLGRVHSQKGDFNVDDESFELIRKQFKDRKLDLVIDYEHQTLSDVQAPAGGWIKDLYKGEDAIIAKVEWTPKAAEYLKNKEYRYLSPVVLVRKRDQKATAIHSVALTNTPAIDGMFALVNSLDIEDISEGGNIMDLKELAKALGLPETATEEEIKKAVEDAVKAAEKLKEMDGKKPGEGDGKPGDGEPKPEGADMVANSTILSMLGLKADAKTEDVAASIMALKAGAPDTQAELLALKQRMAERDADEEVQKALKAGKITAAQSEWAKSYALKDMEGFKGFVDKAPVVVPQGKLDLKDAPAASNSDEVDVAILKNMGVSMEDVKKYNKKEDYEMNRAGNERTGIRMLKIPVKGGAELTEATMAAINSDGYAVEATASAGLLIAGCVQRYCDNRNGADGEQPVSVKRGTFVWENDGTIKETDILKKCYIKDEKTVTITADGSSVAGTILEVDDDGVTVDITQV